MTEQKRNERRNLKARRRRSDYEKKHNIKTNNWPKEKQFEHHMVAGDRTLPKSRKYPKKDERN